MTRPPHFERRDYCGVSWARRNVRWIMQTRRNSQLVRFYLGSQYIISCIKRLIFLHIIIHCNYLLINNQVPRHKLLVKVRIIHVTAQWEYWEYLFIE